MNSSSPQSALLKKWRSVGERVIVTVCVDSGFLHLFSFGKVHTLSLSSRHEATGTLGLPRAEFEKLLKCCAFCESADFEHVGKQALRLTSGGRVVLPIE